MQQGRRPRGRGGDGPPEGTARRPRRARREDHGGEGAMTAVATGNDLPAAAKPTVRDQALDAVSTVLRGKDWSAVTMAAVARQAGVSRQTLYNEFGSRKGLAVAYVTRFVDGLLAF
ncbi:TetR/AcrR family transcriptional regulator, partial [Tsukamurella strandjordii]|uniref:TetR/AcrR family transcriptional regulator n=1 Tax=Tsukamurella strandjordii TaxID=147577 RepID=UPI0039EF1502